MIKRLNQLGPAILTVLTLDELNLFKTPTGRPKVMSPWENVLHDLCCFLGSEGEMKLLKRLEHGLKWC